MTVTMTMTMTMTGKTRYMPPPLDSAVDFPRTKNGSTLALFKLSQALINCVDCSKSGSKK